MGVTRVVVSIHPVLLHVSSHGHGNHLPELPSALEKSRLKVSGAIQISKFQITILTLYQAAISPKKSKRHVDGLRLLTRNLPSLCPASSGQNLLYGDVLGD